MSQDKHPCPSEAAHFGSHGGRLVGPRRRVGDAAQAEPGAARLHPRPDRPALELDECGFTPLEGKSALDVGCGAGLLAEPLARLGATVTAVDAAPGTDRGRHGRMPRGGAGDRLSRGRRSRSSTASSTSSPAMEVIEHVADPRRSSPPRRAARARRAADPVDPQPHRLVEAADDHPRPKGSAGSPRARTITTSSSPPRG